MERVQAKHIRLPRTIKPIHYKLEFVPNFSGLTFTGHSFVELEVLEPTNQIIFNSKGLKIFSAFYKDDSPAIIYTDEQEIVTFEFSTILQPGKGQLALKFIGSFATDMLGLYHSTYNDANGKKCDVLATQFESVFARRAFPCIDEPDRKATFEISIVALDNQVALSNMPEIYRNLDLVAIPDFACNAMENWGLITYRETALLIDPENSSLLSKQSVALTVAHEVSHMWFDYCFPDYDIWTKFVSKAYICARRLDELKCSHPIEIEVNSAQEVEEIFDVVSYQKGSCVIRMLYKYMGASRFREGLQSYFEKFKYSNASTRDLWAVLEATGVDGLTEFMSLWTKQTGYPVVFARLIRANDGKYSIGLKQQRFLVDGISATSEPPVRWCVPIIICTMEDSNNILLNVVTHDSNFSPSSAETSGQGDENQPPAGAVVESQELIYTLPNCVRAPQVRLNPDALGFYRVHYDSAMMSAILEAIARGAVPERDRITLIDDQFALARAGYQTLDRVLQFCLAFVGEEKCSVWSALSEGLSEVRILLEEASYPMGNKVVFPKPSKEILGLYRLYAELALPVYAKIGFTPTSSDSNSVCLLRPIIISILGHIGHEDVIYKARVAFERHYTAVTSPLVKAVVDQSQLISPDLRSAIYSICLRNGGEVEFQKLLELYDQATLSDERVRILSSLGAVTNADIIQRLFKFTFTEDVRKQDRFHVLTGVAQTPGGRRALWNLVRSRIATLSEDLGTSHLLTRVLMESGSNFASQEFYEEIRAFYEMHDVPCPRATQQILELVKLEMLLEARMTSIEQSKQFKLFKMMTHERWQTLKS
ncbi:Puromycin-sensitive aminopeptidase [Taenia crassiceps]|uniref:Aminopeptidase n=1 Tax=Taenia crassiceps TaxID=6207 RepID=A0ABR4Q402_9CEST